MHDDDPLFTGGPLPEDLTRLERRLSQLPLPPEPDWDAARAHEARTPQLLFAAAAALLLAALAGGGWLARDAWLVETVAGSPKLAGFAFAGRLGMGGTLSTDGASRARLLVTGLGEVELEPGSVLRRVRGHGEERRLALDHGELHARISAPPRQFVVETRGAVATDLGCAYTLVVARDGSGRLTVTSGRVAFADRGHESFVPAGLWCPLRTDGVGVPRREYAGDAFIEAVAAYDSPARAPGSLDTLLSRAEALDAITLWHLLPRVSGDERVRVATRIAALIEVPSGVPLARVLALEPAALDAWWDALGMGATSEWRAWESGRAPGR